MRKIRYAAAHTSDLLPDTGKTIRLGESEECTLFAHLGKWFAVGSLCPHQNAPLDGALAEDGCVTCRRHGYRFDLNTGDCTTLGGYGIPVYEVSVEEDIVYVSLWDFE